MEIEDGWYHAYSGDEIEPCLVRAYTITDTGERGIGFNIYEGGGFVPLSDLKEDTVLIPVEIIELP